MKSGYPKTFVKWLTVEINQFREIYIYQTMIGDKEATENDR